MPEGLGPDKYARSLNSSQPRPRGERKHIHARKRAAPLRRVNPVRRSKSAHGPNASNCSDLANTKRASYSPAPRSKRSANSAHGRNMAARSEPPVCNQVTNSQAEPPDSRLVIAAFGLFDPDDDEGITMPAIITSPPGAA